MALITLMEKLNSYEMWEDAKQIKEKVAEGELSAIKILVAAKILTDIAFNIREFVMPFAVSELQKQGKDFEIHGYALRETESGTRWDFDVCEDLDIPVLKSKVEFAKSELEHRQNLLKKFQENPFLKEIEDEQTSELIQRPKIAPVKKSTTIVGMTWVGGKNTKPKKN